MLRDLDTTSARLAATQLEEGAFYNDCMLFKDIITDAGGDAQCTTDIDMVSYYIDRWMRVRETTCVVVNKALGEVRAPLARQLGLLDLAMVRWDASTSTGTSEKKVRALGGCKVACERTAGCQGFQLRES